MFDVQILGEYGREYQSESSFPLQQTSMHIEHPVNYLGGEALGVRKVKGSCGSWPLFLVFLQSDQNLEWVWVKLRMNCHQTSPGPGIRRPRFRSRLHPFLVLDFRQLRLVTYTWPKRIKSRDWNRYLYTHVRNSITHNSQKAETARMSIDG